MRKIKFGAAAAAAVLASSYAASAVADDDFLANDVRLGSYTVLYHANANNLNGPYVRRWRQLHGGEP